MGPELRGHFSSFFLHYSRNRHRVLPEYFARICKRRADVLSSNDATAPAVQANAAIVLAISRCIAAVTIFSRSEAAV
jgi:hypothetical protein